MQVKLEIFQKVYIHYLVVGHTHNPIDQCFGNISQFLLRCDITCISVLLEKLRLVIAIVEFLNVIRLHIMHRRLRSSGALLSFPCPKLSISSGDLRNTKLEWRDSRIYGTFALRWVTTTKSHCNGKARHPQNCGKVVSSTSQRIQRDRGNLLTQPLCVLCPEHRQG